MLYVCVGPTGSGKTDLAIALAKRLNAPIINADAFQVYRGMNIGTNKEMAQFVGLKTYLFDVVNPQDGYTVAQYQRAFRQLMDTLDPVHQPVIVVGGTGLYIKASLYDFEFKPHEAKVDMQAYHHLDEATLYSQLQAIDPEAAQSIHPHNRRRVMRAIEIYLQTGEKKSNLEARQKKESLYPVRYFGLNPSREKLYERINQRVITMIERGLVQEVEQLLNTVSPTAYAMDAIGYKEVIQYLQGTIDLPTTIAMIQQATRRYAKRQWTYFRNQLPVEWYASVEDVLEVFKDDQSV